MKSISVHVSEHAYEEFKSLASRRGRAVAELIREAMDSYLEAERRSSRSILDLEPLRCGRLLRPWTREEIFDEVRDR
jgi:hypothetical protein